MTRRVSALMLAVAATLALPAAPRAAPGGEAVALLPLDADRSLEIYGQPVASELARALGAGNVSVVVIGPRMAVPERARLIVDGTITHGSANAVTIALRVRRAVDGVVIETLSATAPGLAKIDGAAAELSAELLPIVRAQLAALPPVPVPVRGRPPARPPAPDRPVLIGIADGRSGAAPGPLAGALDAAIARWIHGHRRPVHKLEAAQLVPRSAPGAVVAGGADLAIGFWILGWTVESSPDTAAVALARARVRVRIAGPSAVLFDRVVATDSVVGDRGLPEAELAARVAREILAIVEPHLARSVPSWR